MPKPAVQSVDIPEWGGTVLVQELSGTGRDAVIHSARPRVALVVNSLVDEHGQRLFTDSTDIDALANKSATAVDRICEVGWTLNALSRVDMDRQIIRLRTTERFFYFQLARELGYASVTRMLEEMTSSDISEWRAFFKIERELMEENTADLDRRAAQMEAERHRPKVMGGG